MNDEPNTALAEVRTGSDIAAPSNATFNAAAIWTSFQEMAKNPDMDAAKMATMYELQKTMILDQKQQEFNEAKFAAMADMPQITKNKIVKSRDGKVMYRYSDFKRLYQAVKPILSAQGLILDFDVSETDGETKVPMLRVAPILRHRNGYVWLGSHMPVPITAANSAISLTQAAKGAVETGKRTVTISCLGITEDEDLTMFENEGEVSPEHEKMIEDAQRAATGGPKEYGAWLNRLTNAQKGWMITSGHHDKMTEAARAIAAQNQEGQ